MEGIKAQLMAALVGMIMKMLSPDLLKQFIDMALDFVEDKVLGTASTIDDAIVLPICNMIREAFNVPDND
jgi:hypothetical protein